jgi:hypothetical protein
MTSHQSATGTSEQATGMQDKTYNLVSVLYHALQGGETCMQYMQDAEQEGDQELVQFFHEVQDCQRHLAGRAKEILKQRLGQGNGEGWNREQRMGMHQHTAGRSQPGSQGYTDAGTQGTVGPQRHVKTSDLDQEEARGGGEGLGRRSPR